MSPTVSALMWVGLLLPTSLFAGETIAERMTKLERSPELVRIAVGVTRKDTEIPGLIAKEFFDPDSKYTHILLVGGWQDDGGVTESLEALEWFYFHKDAEKWRETFRVSALPRINPDNNNPPKFPPRGEAYFNKTNAEAEYVWRWIHTHPPDFVVAMMGWEDNRWWFPWEGRSRILPRISSVLNSPKDDTVLDDSPAAAFADAFVRAPKFKGDNSYNLDEIPACVLTCNPKSPSTIPILHELCTVLTQRDFRGPSNARKLLQQRIERSPQIVARQLSKIYGHDLRSVQYIPAVALIGRLRYGRLNFEAEQERDVRKIVAPYLDGTKASLPKKFSGSHLSGHLVFAEIARTTKDPELQKQCLKLVRAAADTGFLPNGEMKPAMPAHNEMSDAVFMACPILVEAGVQTGEQKYFKMAHRHFEFMKAKVLREDGLYRHSPLCETAWGRGNAFPALGLAWCLDRLDPKDALLAVFSKAFQNHMDALARHQDPDGMWHQIIDRPGSYCELSCTCMITYALIRGVRNGWLPAEKYEPIIQKAHKAIKVRILPEGTLIDVCTGTGKQKTERDYYDRKAILGRDPRGGAMALLVMTELASWQNSVRP